MTDNEIFSLIAQETSLNPEKLDLTATISSLDITSLDLVSLLFEIEDRFRVVIEPEDIPGDTTLGDLIKRIRDTSPA